MSNIVGFWSHKAELDVEFLRSFWMAMIVSNIHSNWFDRLRLQEDRLHILDEVEVSLLDGA